MNLSRQEELELIKSTIQIDEWLANFAIFPDRENAGKKWYKSPLRDEKTASFVVDTNTNRWRDFGTQKGGSIIDLAMEFLNCSYIETVQNLRKTLYKK
jgi:DNA primase